MADDREEPNGAAFLELLRLHAGPASGIDDAFEREVASIGRWARADLDVDPWRE